MASQAYVSLTSLGSLPCEVKHYNCIFISLFRGKANPDGYGQRSDSRQKSTRLFLPMTRVVPELGCDFRRNQLRFRTGSKKAFTSNPGSKRLPIAWFAWNSHHRPRYDRCVSTRMSSDRHSMRRWFSPRSGKLSPIKSGPCKRP